MKRGFTFLLVLAILLAQAPGAWAEVADPLTKIHKTVHMSLEDAAALLADASEDTAAELLALVEDLRACEGIYVQEREADDYEAYTATLEIWLEKGEPRCAVDYTNYMGMLSRYPAPITRAEKGAGFHTEPSDGIQAFQIDFDAENMHIVWGDGACDYRLHKWSGDPKELEDTPFDETEDYDFVVSLLQQLVPKDAESRIAYQAETKTLSLYFCEKDRPRWFLLERLDNNREALLQLEEPLKQASDMAKSYLDIFLKDLFDPVPEPSCIIAFVDHLRDDSNYTDNDLIVEVKDGKVVYNIARNVKKESVPSSAPTVGEKNALKTAKQYLEYTPFSYEGLVKQLEYEGYTHSQAVYGADHCGANWKQEAVAMAKRYLEVSSFSYQGLIDQLEYEGFTHEQAVYGADRTYR